MESCQILDFSLYYKLVIHQTLKTEMKYKCYEGICRFLKAQNKTDKLNTKKN